MGSSSSAFLFYLTFFVFISSGETIIYYGLVEKFLCGGIPV